jgi:UDP-glucose 4-epimerase
MADKTVILITGVAGYWGARVAARLAREPGYHLIGLDVEPPEAEIPGLDFIQADVRNPLLVELFRAEGVDTVCHLAFVDSLRPSEAAFDLNVMGAAHVLGACAEDGVRAGDGVRKVVLKSSTAVYGARPANPLFLSEDHALRGSKRYGYTRDLIEIETFCKNFRLQAPDLALTILRFPGIVGPTADTPMTRFLRDRSAPSLLGFAPMMQIIHEDDVVEALAHAVMNDTPGIFNVAAKDIMPLGKIQGLVGKTSPAVFHPFAYWSLKRRVPAGSRLARHLPIEPDYLRYPWVGDLTRMRDELGFAPHHTAEETLREFGEQLRAGLYRTGSMSLARDEERLREVIEQRQHARESKAPTSAGAKEGGDDE